MICFLLNLAVISMLPGEAAEIQTFTLPAEINITLCPIYYFGQKYDKLYVNAIADKCTVCFKGFFEQVTGNDCILMTPGEAKMGNFLILTKEIPLGSMVHKHLPSLKNSGKCVNIISLADKKSEILQVELGNFWKQAVLGIKTFYGSASVELDLQVNGRTFSTQKFLSFKTKKGVITDMSGCRLAGSVYKLNTKVKDPTTCSTVTCHTNGVVDSISYCGPMEHCQSDGSCIMNTVCSICGSAVIDFLGRVHIVPDRCAYTLLRSSFIPSFHVVGFFREKWRVDRSFLERVELHLGDEDVRISLQQGSRVLLNNRDLMLSDMVQVVHGVEISKDQTGVTVKKSACGYTVSVFFNGDMALIHMTGLSEATVHGLCDDSYGTLCDDKLSEHSATDCEIQYEYTDDSSADCNAATKWCNLLTQAPFAICNADIDPKPFITACKQNLCSYPAEDGHMCQYLQAYAQTCKYHNVIVEDWRSKTNCSSLASCQDWFCSAHEFCSANRKNRERHCYCRALFASKYKTTSSFGELVICGQKSPSVSLPHCLLVEAGIDYSILHLNDQACKGKLNNRTNMVMFGLNSTNNCGAVITTNNSHIIYKNTIKMHDISPADLITRTGQVKMDFYCYYAQPGVQSFPIKLKSRNVIQQNASANWGYNLTMTYSVNSTNTTTPGPRAIFQPKETVLVEMKADGLDKDLVIVTQSCWVTDQPSPDGNQNSYIINNGCPANQAVKVEGNGQGASNYFSLDLLNVSNGTDYINLFCKVVLCVRQEDACVPVCSDADRKRRAAISE